jgi:hypothetical protein
VDYTFLHWYGSLIISLHSILSVSRLPHSRLPHAYSRFTFNSSHSCPLPPNSTHSYSPFLSLSSLPPLLSPPLPLSTPPSLHPSLSPPFKQSPNRQLTTPALTSIYTPALTSIITPANGLIIGISVGILAAAIDIISDWLGDLKEGFCKPTFYLNRGFCCWGISGLILFSLKVLVWNVDPGIVYLGKAIGIACLGQATGNCISWAAYRDCMSWEVSRNCLPMSPLFYISILHRVLP